MISKGANSSFIHQKCTMVTVYWVLLMFMCSQSDHLNCLLTLSSLHDIVVYIIRYNSFSNTCLVAGLME